MAPLTDHKVRELSGDDLGLPSTHAAAASPEDLAEVEAAEPSVTISEDDAVLVDVLNALKLGYAGAILVGPPGTGKSWYAKRIAHYIAGGHTGAVRFVQFHASYQYEDFMEGYAPNDKGGFEPKARTFLNLCRDAEKLPEVDHVLVIDEISRCDAARVLGEALTYIEMDKRGETFTLASGSEMSVPRNLVILATMNPWDKGVDEVDIALERRFAHIEMPPDPGKLRSLLEEDGVEPDLVERLLRFFNMVQGLPLETCRVGHAYFLACQDAESAGHVWRYSLDPFFRRACRLDRPTYDRIRRTWADTVGAYAPAPATPEEYIGEDSSSPVVKDDE